MTCRHIRQLHDAYVDGELSGSLKAEVHAHLLQCPECQRRVETIRACGDVIAGDRSEPVLDSGFATRVVAALQKVSPPEAPTLETRRARRRRLWRMGLGAILPAAAAALFFCVLIWPPMEQEIGPKVVAGKAVSGVEDVVNPALDAVADTREAAENLNHLFRVSVDQAHEQVLRASEEQARKLAEARLDQGYKPGVTVWDVLFEPLTDLLEPPPQPVEDPAQEEVVRF